MAGTKRTYTALSPTSNAGRNTGVNSSTDLDNGESRESKRARLNQLLTYPTVQQFVKLIQELRSDFEPTRRGDGALSSGILDDDTVAVIEAGDTECNQPHFDKQTRYHTNASVTECKVKRPAYQPVKCNCSATSAGAGCKNCSCSKSESGCTLGLCDCPGGIAMNACLNPFNKLATSAIFGKIVCYLNSTADWAPGWAPGLRFTPCFVHWVRSQDELLIEDITTQFLFSKIYGNSAIEFPGDLDEHIEAWEDTWKSFGYKIDCLPKRPVRSQDKQQLLDYERIKHELKQQLLQIAFCINEPSEFYFSFCRGKWVEGSCTWHCEMCGKCRNREEWHCGRCGTCTYSTSLPCKCGGVSRMYHDDEVNQQQDRWTRETAISNGMGGP